MHKLLIEVEAGNEATYSAPIPSPSSFLMAKEASLYRECVASFSVFSSSVLCCLFTWQYQSYVYLAARECMSTPPTNILGQYNKAKIEFYKSMVSYIYYSASCRTLYIPDTSLVPRSGLKNASKLFCSVAMLKEVAIQIHF